MIPYDERYGPEEIARRVEDVGRRIAADFPEGELVLVAVLKGASMFMADLARSLTRPVRLEYIDVIRDDEGDDMANLHFVTSFKVTDRDVVILKDVIRTGVIETYLLNQIREERPRSIRFAALVDRPQERKSSLYVDYVLFPSEEGVLVGYGMEYGGLGGNLPFIAQVRTSGDAPFTGS